MVSIKNQFLQALLNVPAEVLAIKHIDSAVHEPEAVGGTYNRVTGQSEYRPAMDCYRVEIATELQPRFRHLVFDCCENYLHDSRRRRALGRLLLFSSQIDLPVDHAIK